MGTRWSVTCDTAPDQDREWLHEALQATVEQVDAQMSPWKPDSDLVRLNREEVGTWVELPAEPLQVLARALEINRLSAGAFDPALGDLVDAWGFGPVRDAPDAAAIRAARDQDRGPAHQRLELDLGAGRARKRAPVQLDLCGIAKGYAVDRMVDALRRHGVAHALVALDGELRALGSQADGQPWPVALESPQDGAPGGARRDRDGGPGRGDLGRLPPLRAGRPGARGAHHGRPPGRTVHNDVASVTVLAATCTDADAWATALLVAGPGEAGPRPALGPGSALAVASRGRAGGNRAGTLRYRGRRQRPRER